MKLKILIAMILCFILVCGAASAELRTYRQFKDVSVKEKGKVSQSSNEGDLFECTYDINKANNTITRVKIRRLDDPVGRDDSTVYDITQRKELIGSEAGNGGHVIVAIRRDGEEILELSHRFAFTMRTSPFSQVITGVYKRVYDKDHDDHFHKN